MKYFISLLLLVTFISCSEDSSEPAVYQTEQDIIDYAAKNELNPTRTESGLYYIKDLDGNEKFPSESSKVTFTYTLSLLDGSVIEESSEEGFETYLAALIPGLSEGLTYFDEGSEGTFLIHPFLAYGNSGNSLAGYVLIFDVKILKITDPEDEILAYLDANNLEAQKSETGLYYIIEEEGDGEQISTESTINAIYEGYYLDGTSFDTSNGLAVPINLENVIPGFSEGASYFKEGGKGKLFIPPNLAYGVDGTISIPGNSVLIFDIEVQSLAD